MPLKLTPEKQSGLVYRHGPKRASMRRSSSHAGSFFMHGGNFNSMQNNRSKQGGLRPTLSCLLLLKITRQHSAPYTDKVELNQHEKLEI